MFSQNYFLLLIYLKLKTNIKNNLSWRNEKGLNNLDYILINMEEKKQLSEEEKDLEDFKRQLDESLKALEEGRVYEL